MDRIVSVTLFRFAAFVGLKNGMTVETPVAAAKVDVDDDQNNMRRLTG